MITCIGCKYLKGNLFCVSPNNGINLTDGKPQVQMALLNRKRDCGEFALWKEVEIVPTRKWWQFWRKK